MSRKRHVIVGGGTAGLNAITTIREYDKGASDIVLVAEEWPYSRMVLPYYLGQSISESHVFTATAPRLAQLGVQFIRADRPVDPILRALATQPQNESAGPLGPDFVRRRASGIDTANNLLKLDDGSSIEYDDLLIATGSSPTRPPIPGADGEGIYNQWTIDDSRGVLKNIKPGQDVAMIGAGFISFTILNSVLNHGVNLHIIEIMPQVLPRMIDNEGAEIVANLLRNRGVNIQTGVSVKSIEDVDGRKKLVMDGAADLTVDLVIMGTGIRPNLGWLNESGLEIDQGIIVDDHLRSNVANVYAAGDVAQGHELITRRKEVHAIEPTAMQHGRVVGANMTGRDISYEGSLLMNILDVQDLDVASFGSWNVPGAETSIMSNPKNNTYRKLVWDEDKIIGGIILGPARGIWTTNDIGMLKGLVQSQVRLGPWKKYLQENMWDIKRPFVANHVTNTMLSVTTLDHPTVPAREISATGASGGASDKDGEVVD